MAALYSGEYGNTFFISVRDIMYCISVFFLSVKYLVTTKSGRVESA